MKRFHLITALLLSSLLISCGGTPKTFYYSLNYDMPEASASSIPVTLGIKSFEADIVYSGDRLVYRDSPYELQYYHYRRWAAAPRKIVHDQVLKQIQSSGAFENVIGLPSTAIPDYILQAKVNALEEWDEANAWYGNVSIAFELLDVKTRKIVWRKDITERTPATERSPLAVVKAISASLKTVVDEAITDMSQTLKTQ
ncbi:MAG: ABC-type transport auxiliary lipoprotein family protein [Calditrichia bacterium]